MIAFQPLTAEPACLIMFAAGATAPYPIESLYSHHHGWLLGWLRPKLGCSHQAADLAHDTFLRLLVRPRTLDPEQDPRAYLTTIARGLVVDHWRRQAIERAWLAALAMHPEAFAPSPEHQAIVLETLCEVDAMLASLLAKPRRAFLLAQLHGVGYAQIAQELNVSERMVKKYMAQVMLCCLQFDTQYRAATCVHPGRGCGA